MFETTRWSLVLAAAGDAADARAALEQLCRIYRPAVLAYLRSHGHARSDAEDLTQGFFTRFIEKRLHATAQPDRGRFRAYLRTALQHFVINAGEHAHAARRHSGAPASGIDPDSTAASDHEQPDQAFERAWALALVQRALQRLHDEAAAAGKAALFERLRHCLVETPEGSEYVRIGAELGVRPNTVAVAAHRLRERLRSLVRDEVAATVADVQEVDAEYEVVAAALRDSRAARR